MVSQNNKDKESECMSLTVDYKQYFSKLEVPITEEQVDSMYDSPDLEWGDTLPGKILYLWGNWDTFEKKLNQEYDEEDLDPDSPMGVYYYSIKPQLLRRQYLGATSMELPQNFHEKLLNLMKAKMANVNISPEDWNQNIGEDRARAKAPELAIEIPREAAKQKETKPLPEELPKFDDEYELLGNKPSNVPFGSMVPSIGDSDLYPMGQKYPSLRPSLDPFSGSSGNGMIPGKDHPLFGQQGPQGPQRGDHPPGARYDDPMSGSDLGSEGLGLPGGSLNGAPFSGSPFGPPGGSPFGGSSGFM
jgi:hypothetical protein